MQFYVATAPYSFCGKFFIIALTYLSGDRTALADDQDDVCQSDEAIVQHGIKNQDMMSKRLTKRTRNELERKQNDSSAPHTPTPSLHCPLCQEQFEEYSVLETHVMLIHSVNSDGLNRLLLLMEGSHWLNNSQSKHSDYHKDKTDNEENKSGNERVEEHEGKGDKSTFEIVHESEPCVNLSDEEDNLACQLGATVSSRHLYKFRCGQCSLAFKTSDKLAFHSRYHAIREATRCKLCERSFRSISSLLRHVESKHEVTNKNKEVEYNAEEVNIVGGSHPGFPLVIVGKTDYTSWGVTAS